MAEGIDVVADFRFNAEGFLEIIATARELLVPTRFRRAVGIRLNQLSAGGKPTARCDERAHALEEFGVDARDVFVKPRFAARVKKFGIFVAALCRRVKDGNASSTPSCQRQSQTGSMCALPIM
jgi:hypothetical protein